MTPRRVTRRGPRRRGHPCLSYGLSARKTWMAGTSPAMTPNKWFDMTGTRCSATRNFHPAVLADMIGAKRTLELAPREDTHDQNALFDYRRRLLPFTDGRGSFRRTC